MLTVINLLTIHPFWQLRFSLVFYTLFHYLKISQIPSDPKKSYTMLPTHQENVMCVLFQRNHSCEKKFRKHISLYFIHPRNMYEGVSRRSIYFLPELLLLFEAHCILDAHYMVVNYMNNLTIRLSFILEILQNIKFYMLECPKAGRI